MKPHPYADVLPLLEGKALADLAADIKTNGLREPIVPFAGMILDGRNRWNACKVAGVEPRFVDYQGNDPLAFVISMNVRRRHLDESQRSLIASRLANMRQGERTDLQPSANLRKVSQAEAAELLNVSERSVTFAALVETEATPALVRAVEQGKIAVSLAAKLARSSEAVQRQAAAEPERAHVLVKQERRAERETALGAEQMAWPTKIYGAFLIDPPWRFEPWSRETGMDRAADNHYPTMSLDEIKALAPKIASIAAKNSVAFVCATQPMLAQAIEVMAARGFECKSQCFWVKDKSGHGHWFINQHEILLVGTKGDIPAPAPGTQWPSVTYAPVGRHSEKPEIFAEMIEGYFPTLPKIELFARGKARPGWDAWGNEVEPR